MANLAIGDSVYLKDDPESSGVITDIEVIRLNGVPYHDYEVEWDNGDEADFFPSDSLIKV